jgi:hypothetical protein
MVSAATKTVTAYHSFAGEVEAPRGSLPPFAAFLFAGLAPLKFSNSIELLLACV